MKAGLVIVGLFAGVALLALRPVSPPRTAPAATPPGKSDPLHAGAQLAVRYCGLCHHFPEPALLDKRTWTDKVLPNMALRLGLRKDGQDPYESIAADERPILQALNSYPDQPMLTEDQWKEIVAYYQKEAPAIPLPQKAHRPILPNAPLFDVKQLSFDEKPIPRISMLRYDPATRQLYVGDAQPMLYILSNQFAFQSAWTLESAPVAMDFPKNAPPRLLTIGSFAPSDRRLGRLLSLDTAGTTPPSSLVNIPALPRPVQFAGADLNMDGKEDLVVCGFGHHAGKLSWYEGAAANKEQVLTAMPGALKVEVGDFNADGRPDLMVLMGQAWERLSVFYNVGNGKFREEPALQFHPAFGASWFELVDFNSDGYPDILLANGDNWDYSRINKNYHGVRIYLNDGNYHFTERWFFPLYGASKAMARDFDGDGDLDIAAISFYADEGQLQNGFTYFEWTDAFDFIPHALPDAIHGKWLTMEIADFDEDGDPDIVLGSYLHNLAELSLFTVQGASTLPQLLVLTNQTIRRPSAN
ncbi:FG-GAP repeat domain-containing protein [Parapedobacter sp.]